jgi:CRP-like cAMP-binding protein
VANLQTGNTFGELALINDAPRAANIKAISNCYFATIEKTDYQKIL